MCVIQPVWAGHRSISKDRFRFSGPMMTLRTIKPQFSIKLSLCWSSAEVFYHLTSLFSLSYPPLHHFAPTHQPGRPPLTRASPHPNMPGHDGGVGAVGLHWHHCQRGGNEVHQGGRQQPGHQDSHCRDRRSSLSAGGYGSSCANLFVFRPDASGNFGPVESNSDVLINVKLANTKQFCCRRENLFFIF